MKTFTLVIPQTNALLADFVTVLIKDVMELTIYGFGVDICNKLMALFFTAGFRLLFLYILAK